MFNEEFWTNVSSLLPSLEYRVFFIICLILVLLIIIIANKLGKRIKKRTIQPEIFKAKWLEKVDKVYKVVSKILYVLLIISIVGLIIFTGLTVFLARPYGYMVNYQENGRINSTHERIEIAFDLPIKSSVIKPNISPEIEGEWIYEDKSWGDYYKKVTFYPKESFYPDDKIVVYITGLSRMLSGGVKHEQAIEAFAPADPEVDTVYPQNLQEHVMIDQTFDVTFKSVIGDFVEFTYEIEPAIDFEEIRESDKSLKLKFENNLAQDSNYKVKIFRSLRSYKIDSNETIKKSEPELIWQGEFFTVKAPSIASISHSGQNARADLPLQIEFVEPMNQESVGELFVLEPAIEGETTWEGETKMIFTPSQSFAKDSNYKIKFGAGMATLHGGKTLQDIILEFKTLGKVSIDGITPSNGAKDIDPKTANIVISFNQEVDKSSAESKITISPDPQAAKIWDGNRLIFLTAQKLSYNTKYSIKINSGVKSLYGLDSTDTFNYTFTTKAQTFTLAVPLHYQQERFTCNVAATKMALAYRGVNLSESSIKNGIGIGGDPNANWVEGYGTHADPVATFIRNYRSATVFRGWNASALAKEVEAGNPVILFWHNRVSAKETFTLPSGATGYRGMHSEVVIGFTGSSDNPTSFIVNDPWRGRLVYTPNLFNSTWSYLNKTAVVVY